MSSSFLKSMLVPVLAIATIHSVSCDRKSSSGNRDDNTPTPTASPSTIPLNSDTLEPAIRELITSNCIGCHQPNKSAEEYSFVDDKNVFALRSEIVAVLNVDDCIMPPRKPDVCKSEAVQRLAAWAKNSLAGTPTPEPTVEPTPTPEPTVAPTGVPGTLDPAIRQIITDNCIGCHKPGKSAEEYSFIEDKAVLELRGAIVNSLRMDDCFMPPRKPDICKSEAVQKLAAWAAAGSIQ